MGRPSQRRTERRLRPSSIVGSMIWATPALLPDRGPAPPPLDRLTVGERRTSAHPLNPLRRAGLDDGTESGAPARRRSGIEETDRARPPDRLAAAVGVELPVQGGDVRVDRVRRDRELCRDLLLAALAGQEVEDAPLRPGERSDESPLLDALPHPIEPGTKDARVRVGCEARPAPPGPIERPPSSSPASVSNSATITRASRTLYPGMFACRIITSTVAMSTVSAGSAIVRREADLRDEERQDRRQPAAVRVAGTAPSLQSADGGHWTQSSASTRVRIVERDCGQLGQTVRDRPLGLERSPGTAPRSRARRRASTPGPSAPPRPRCVARSARCGSPTITSASRRICEMPFSARDASRPAWSARTGMSVPGQRSSSATRMRTAAFIQRRPRGSSPSIGPT